MNILFEHISNNTLTPNVLDNLLAEGVDIDEEDEKGFTALTRACESGNIEQVRMLLDRGADIYAGSNRSNHDSPMMIAYTTENVALLLMLMKHGANVDTDTPDDVQKTIKELMCSDEHLSKYPQVLSLVESIKVVDFAVDACFGFSDNAIELIILKLGNEMRFHLEYFLVYNCFDAEFHLCLTTSVGDNGVRVLSVHHIWNNRLFLPKESIKALCDLALQLNLGDLTLELFTFFLILLLSRMIQKKDVLYSSLQAHHYLYFCLDPVDQDNPEELLVQHYSQTPIKDIIFNN